MIAPHPDDETLGCGATILKHITQGDSVYWVIVTSISQELGFSLDDVNLREKQIKIVSDSYGFEKVFNLNFATAELDVVPIKQLVGAMAKVLNDVKPDLLYIPYRGDAHSDHKVVFDVIASCTKTFRYPFIRRVCIYETLSETEFGIRPDDTGFRPNLWIDVSDFIDQKIEIMKIYDTEIEEHPFPRSELSIKALATLRGANAGVEAAEAFMMIKEIL